MRSVTGNGAVVFTVLLLAAVVTTPAGAASGRNGPEDPPGQAQFEDRHINLQRGWGDARTCVVWNEDGETDCFRTEQAADAAIARRERAETRAVTRAAATDRAAWTGTWDVDRRTHRDVVATQAASACSSWLTLYEHIDHDGRSLRFRDVGTTQDLDDWGFGARTSSYRVGGCHATLRDADGVAYPGWTGPHISASRMLPGWNDRVQYLRIR